MTALKQVRAATDAWHKAGGMLAMSGMWRKRQFEIINHLWRRLMEEKPEWFFEHRKKTTEIGISQFGKIVQKVKVERMALAAMAGEPFEDGEVFVKVAALGEWAEIETVQVPSVISVPEDQQVDGDLEAVMDDGGEIQG